MFGVFRKRISQTYNTVNLDDDLGDVELLQAFEEVFGITIEDHERERILTVGQLYELVNAKVAEQSGFDPIWALTVQMVREHSGSKDGIDRDTTFFPKDAQKRASEREAAGSTERRCKMRVVRSVQSHLF